MKRFKVRATITWEFECDGAKAVAAAEKDLQKLLVKPHPNVGDFGVSTSVRLDELKRERLVRLGVFSPDDVLPYIGSNKQEYVVGGTTYKVRLNSHRYFVFRSSLKCVSCGIEGTKMVLEKQPNAESPHFNLYAEGEHGKLILMTKDHIWSKSRGGEDRHSNYQTMCAICNNLKADVHLTLEAVKHLRMVYDENYNHLSKKELWQLIKSTRNNLLLEKTQQSVEEEDGYLFANADINIWREEDKLIGLPVYDQSEGEHIACIKIGTKVKVLETNEDFVKIECHGAEYYVRSGLLE